MNELVSDRFVERVSRLALGIEAVDAQRRGRISHPIRIALEGTIPGLARPQVWRHDSCLFVLFHEKGEGATVELRFFDSAERVWRPQADRRRYVPRRLSIPLLGKAHAEKKPYAQRVRRIALFPGAAYDACESLTGMRGRVERNGEPVRWTRVMAFDSEHNRIIGRAYGDDRGEFLLLLDAATVPLEDLATTWTLDLHVYVPKPPTGTVSEAMKKADPLWDLPMEAVGAPGDLDVVCAGDFPWIGWNKEAVKPVEFTLGRMSRQIPPLTL